MSLRDEAEAAFREILSCDEGAVWPVTLTSPSGESRPLDARTNDIHLVVDPNTGVAVSGRQASVVLSWRDVTALGIGTPQGVSNPTVKPWTVAFDDLYGSSYVFKIKETHPDRDIGSLVCYLEIWT